MACGWGFGLPGRQELANAAGTTGPHGMLRPRCAAPRPKRWRRRRPEWWRGSPRARAGPRAQDAPSGGHWEGAWCPTRGKGIRRRGGPWGPCMAADSVQVVERVGKSFLPSPFPHSFFPPPGGSLDRSVVVSSGKVGARFPAYLASQLRRAIFSCTHFIWVCGLDPFAG